MRSKTFIATPPGATIKEQLTERRMSQKEFAIRMDMSEKHISRLINGEVQLTPDVAMRLELVLGVPAHFWNNLESIYREKLIKVQFENEMEHDKELVKCIPYNEMAKLGWVPETKNTSDRVTNSRKFFEVVHLGLVTESSLHGIACRKLGDTEKSNYALLAWAQKAKLEARNIETEAINIDKLKASLPTIREMTEQNPKDFCPALCKILAACGIAIVFLPHLKGSYLHGASFYDGSKIVIGMTVRGKYADRFWFSLFHEFAHIILGHIGKAEGTDSLDERSADTFAQNQLIPPDEYELFVSKGHFDKHSVILFSHKVGIAPGIVVGRLQKEEHIPSNWYTDLKKKYELTA